MAEASRITAANMLHDFMRWLAKEGYVVDALAAREFVAKRLPHQSIDYRMSVVHKLLELAEREAKKAREQHEASPPQDEDSAGSPLAGSW
jgi:hypothetical protein